MGLPEQKQRARSARDKAQRKAAILDAAREMIAEDGFDAVTMNALAARAGLAKGTLYLYLRTKEELFLALFVVAMEEFVLRFEAEAAPENLPELITGIAVEVPLFLPLYARLAAVIETNVNDEVLFAAKREIFALSERMAARIGAVLDLPGGQAAAVTEALVLAMQGAAQFDLSAGRDPATLPEDMKQHYAENIFAARFPQVAELILLSVL